MVKKAYSECKGLTDNHNQKNWAWEVKSILAKCELHSYNWWHQSSYVMDSHTERQILDMWLPAVSSAGRGRIGNPTLQLNQS